MQMPDEVSNGQVLEGSGWLIKFGGSRCRWPMKFRMVPVQIADKVELSGAHSSHSRQSSGGLRYKNLPRSSKLLGIAHEFIIDACYEREARAWSCGVGGVIVFPNGSARMFSFS